MVLDNLNTHALGSLFATFPPDEAWRLARRLEFHYTPKHASWLNMAECELSVLAPAVPGPPAGEPGGGGGGGGAVGGGAEPGRRAKLVWSFRVADARRKLAHLYPQDPLR